MKPFSLVVCVKFCKIVSEKLSKFVVEAVVTVNRCFVRFKEQWENCFVVFP